MKPVSVMLVAFVFVTGCGRQDAPLSSMPSPTSGPPPVIATTQQFASLVAARQGFQTKLNPAQSEQAPVDVPPPEVFQIVHYDSPAGKLASYLTPNPQDGQKHPAIVWITGGDCNTIGDVWSEADPANDQTASAFRKSGIVMMFPSLRGGNDNPGVREGLLGEVDDVIAAADFLAKQDYVDPSRIYLGGHSTGGTLVLLVAECSDKFRAIFSFGPVHNVAGYGPEYTPFDRSNLREFELRSPGSWLASIKNPTFVFEGTAQGNLLALQMLSRASINPMLKCLPVDGADHFSVLAPTTKLIAEKVLQDTGPTCTLMFTEDELKRPFGR